MQMLLSVVEQQNFEEDISAQNLNDQQTEVILSIPAIKIYPLYLTIHYNCKKMFYLIVYVCTSCLKLFHS